jgi:hypothetical protein
VKLLPFIVSAVFVVAALVVTIAGFTSATLAESDPGFSDDLTAKFSPSGDDSTSTWEDSGEALH